jgi:hypothetical protein
LPTASHPGRGLLRRPGLAGRPHRRTGHRPHHPLDPWAPAHRACSARRPAVPAAGERRRVVTAGPPPTMPAISHCRPGPGQSARACGFVREEPGVSPDNHARSRPPFQVRHHIAPQVRRRGVAVREDNGVAVALVDVGHPFPVDIAKLQLPVRFCSDHDVPSFVTVSVSLVHVNKFGAFVVAVDVVSDRGFECCDGR